MKKKILITVTTVLGVLLLVVIAYFIYVFASYSRLEDNLSLDPVNINAANESVSLNETYSILTYNVGFGAYTSDYSFFMDGGRYSWARSEEGLRTNIQNIGNTINELNPDFVVMQEVDTDGTRTYHVNEYEMLQGILGDGSYVFAQNYDSAFLMYPLNEPHGANVSGLVTVSPFAIDNALRRSLPISTSFSKFVDLDRCYSVSRIPVENGKFLCIYNVHLSAYTNDPSVREGQLSMLFADMSLDYEAGNYVICGGDYNHNLRPGASPHAPSWASIFPRKDLPAGFSLATDVFPNSDINHDSCRNADAPYNPETTFTVLVDGFIVSNNVSIVSYVCTDYGYIYSDHDPVVMEFQLNP